MNKLKVLNDVKKLYEQGGNIISYLKQVDNREQNSVEDILISYDFQAGTYTEAFERDPSIKQERSKFYARLMSAMIEKIGKEKCSILDAGVGEGTMLGPVLKELDSKVDMAYGFDISWSRIKCAEKFIRDYSTRENVSVNLFTGNLLSIPLMDNSIDIVYTDHAIEPNGGMEKEILMELYRVARNYLLLSEPSYHFANDEARRRMIKNGYITKLYETAKELGYEIERYECVDDKYCMTKLTNPSELIVIKKDCNAENADAKYCCPVSKHPLEKRGGAMYCDDSMLAYPIVGGIPCLLEDNAIIATKFNQFISEEPV